jgi:hypothetical protein
MFICKASTSVLYVCVLVACSLKSKFRWHCLVDYWVCYCMFRSMGTKVFPRVAWPGLMDGNVTNWPQSMSGCSGVVYPGLRLVGGESLQSMCVSLWNLVGSFLQPIWILVGF